MISSSDLAFETLKEYDIFYFKIESIALLALCRSPAILQTELWEQQPQVVAWEVHVGQEENLLPQEGSACRGHQRRQPQSSEVFKILVIALAPFCSPLPNDYAAKWKSTQTNLLVYV